ncbi:MAG: hypothetical protein R3C20_24055 [Planctomycetaceae bacterium]
MNGVEQNPYTPSNAVAMDTWDLSGFARRVSLRALQSTFLAILFCLSFLFLGYSAKQGVTEGWDYTIFFVTEYPLLTAAIVVSNALIRGIFLPRPRLSTVWLPLVAGVASFLSYNWVHFRIESIQQVLFPFGWGNGIFELVIEASLPTFVGVAVEGVWHGMHRVSTRRTKIRIG